MNKLLLLAVLIVASYSLSAQVVNPTRVNFDCTALTEHLELTNTKLYAGYSVVNDWSYPLNLTPGQVCGAVHIYYGNITSEYRLTVSYRYKGVSGYTSVMVQTKYVNGQPRQPWDVNLIFTPGPNGTLTVTNSFSFPNF